MRGGEPGFSAILDDTGISLNSFGDGGGQQSIALLGAFRADVNESLNLICRTFNAVALQAVLAALQVDNVELTPGASYQRPPAFSCGDVTLC